MIPWLEKLRAAGGTATVHDGRLRLSAPRPLPVELVESVRAHKAEIIAELVDAKECFAERAADSFLPEVLIKGFQKEEIQ